MGRNCRVRAGKTADYSSRKRSSDSMAITTTMPTSETSQSTRAAVLMCPRTFAAPASPIAANSPPTQRRTTDRIGRPRTSTSRVFSAMRKFTLESQGAGRSAHSTQPAKSASDRYFPGCGCRLSICVIATNSRLFALDCSEMEIDSLEHRDRMNLQEGAAEAERWRFSASAAPSWRISSELGQKYAI